MLLLAKCSYLIGSETKGNMVIFFKVDGLSMLQIQCSSHNLNLCNHHWFNHTRRIKRCRFSSIASIVPWHFLIWSHYKSDKKIMPPQVWLSLHIRIELGLKLRFDVSYAAVVCTPRAARLQPPLSALQQPSTFCLSKPRLLFSVTVRILETERIRICVVI